MIRLTTKVIAQLTQSIKAFVAIAKEEKSPVGGRVGRIEVKLMDWLLAQYQLMDADYSLEDTRKLLQTDCNLNAQGLDVWLKRLG